MGPNMGMGPMGPRGMGMMGPMMEGMGPMRPRPNGMMTGRGGRGSFRGMPGAAPMSPGRGMAPPGPRGGGFAKRLRPDSMSNHSSPGFLGRGGGRAAVPHPEILDQINESVTPQSVLFLWSDKGHLWSEPHLAQGLLVYAKLVDETCPEDVHKARASCRLLMLQMLMLHALHCQAAACGLVCLRPVAGTALSSRLPHRCSPQLLWRLRDAHAASSQIWQDMRMAGTCTRLCAWCRQRNRAMLVLQMRTHPDCTSMILVAKKNMSSMRPTDCSKIARAMGKLDLQDEDLCVALVDALKALLSDSPPIAVAGIMAGLGQVSYRCAREAACNSTSGWHLACIWRTSGSAH
jgi:hypothetical protein